MKVKKQEFITEQGCWEFYAVRGNIIRCVYRKQEGKQISPLGIERECAASFAVTRQKKEVVLDTGSVCVSAGEQGVTFWNAEKRKLCSCKAKLTEAPYMKYCLEGDKPIVRREKTVDGERNFVENLIPVEDHQAYIATLWVEMEEQTGVHGFGQAEDGIYDYRMQTHYLYQHNMRIPMPFFVTDNGYGILFDCGCLITSKGEKEGLCLTLDMVEQLDFYLIAGNRMDEIIGGYRTLTGKAVMLPKWVYGYIQSKEAYHTQEEILEVAGRYREAGLPIDGIVQDWNTWEPNCWGNKQVDKKRYPDLTRMNKELHAANIHSMISIWPTMSRGTSNYEQMKRINAILADDTTYDAFSEKARDLYWEQMKEELYSSGFDSWWCDSTEPFSGPDWCGEKKREESMRFALVGEEHKRYLGPDRANLFAMMHAKGIYEHQRAENDGKRVVNLTRSGYPSSQKYGTILWSGDICARWEVLRKQVTEAINMGLSGMPYWTFDIGGFFTVKENWQHRGCSSNTDPTPKWFWEGDFEQGVEDYGYRELYVRWFQMGAFLPMFRSHGTDTPREIWHFGKPGEEFYEALVDTLKMRYRLMPYIYSMAGKVWRKDGTFVRSLLFDYAQDETCRKIGDEYLFGDSLLVCPVYEPYDYDRGNVRCNSDHIRRCYLPKGNDWYDFYTGERLQGGQWMARVTPLAQFPVYVRAGALIPMEEELRYAAECADTPLTIHIYPGENGSFDYYEDAGDGYEYENGAYQMIKMCWYDKEKRFTISESARMFEHSLAGRELELVCQGEVRKVFYSGEKMEVTF